MAQDSRKKRKNRQKKIAARIAAQTNRQQLRGLSARLVNTQFTLLALLKQADLNVGDTDGYNVTAETAAQVMADFAYLRWTTERQENGSMQITLVDDRTDVAEVPEAPIPARTDMVSPRSVTAQLGVPEAPVEPARTDIEGA